MICPARNVPKAVTMDMGWECVVSVRITCRDSVHPGTGQPLPYAA